MKVYIGFDSREAVGTYVARHSIERRTKSDVCFVYLKHRNLRKAGFFKRPWIVDNDTGNWRDLIDGRPFSTEFSHTRFLVPALMKYRGWALFFDSDMIFLSDIAKLFALADNRYAVMCVKHNHMPSEIKKMDEREQAKYYRKNWSSFVLWNCGHPSNAALTPEIVNTQSGTWMHGFSWLQPEEIGALPLSYNYIPGVSPSLPLDKIDVLHWTDGGPWFSNIEIDKIWNGYLWNDEYEDWQINGDHDCKICEVPTMAHEQVERERKK